MTIIAILLAFALCHFVRDLGRFRQAEQVADGLLVDAAHRAAFIAVRRQRQHQGLGRQGRLVGGAGPAVGADADLDWAVPRIAAGSFAYAGQICISVQRILVHTDVYDAFRDAFVAHLGQGLEVGDRAALLASSERYAPTAGRSRSCPAIPTLTTTSPRPSSPSARSKNHSLAMPSPVPESPAERINVEISVSSARSAEMVHCSLESLSSTSRR